MLSEFLQISFVPLLIGICASLACALPGNFLVLRRQSMIGDAVSHVVLPGIVCAFIITGGLTTISALLGAAMAAIIAVLMIELIRRFGRVEPGAATGVVFTTLFAFGVLLLEQSRASTIHLDVEHALYGNLESLIWLDAQDWSSLLNSEALSTLPEQLPRLGWTLLVVIAFITVCWRALVIGTFDNAFANSIGAAPQWTSLVLLIVVAISAVAAFEAVGAIIVVAMFIVPAATARLLTSNLKTQVLLSALFAFSASVLGYYLAAWAPQWIGLQHSVSAAGMIAVVSGCFLLASCCRYAWRTNASVIQH